MATDTAFSGSAKTGGTYTALSTELLTRWRMDPFLPGAM